MSWESIVDAAQARQASQSHQRRAGGDVLTTQEPCVRAGPAYLQDLNRLTEDDALLGTRISPDYSFRGAAIASSE